MDEQTIFRMVNTEGYHLLERLHPHCPGYSGLLVAIRKTPTKQHFDPESIGLCLSESHQKVGMVKLVLASPFSGVQQICPGRITLHDRIDKRAYFFVYGGTLEAISRDETTVYSFQSSAPILAISAGLEGVPEQLASETEAILAKMHAKWGLNDQGFMQHLVQIDPLVLYSATIRFIHNTYQKNPALRRSYHALYETLFGEKEWLIEMGKWPTTPPGLEDLLSAPL